MSSPRLRSNLYALLLTAAAVAAPPGALAASALDADDARNDLAVLYDRLQASHYDLFARRSREDYDALYSRMRLAFDRPLDPVAVRRELQRFVASGNVAHASIGVPAVEWRRFREAGGRAFPLYFRVSADRVFVEENVGGDPAIAAGDEVLAVDDIPVLEWLAPLRELVSADTDRLAHAQMEGLLPLLLWWNDDRRDAWSLTLRTPGGTRKAWVRSRSRAEILSNAATGSKPACAPDPAIRDARMLAGRIAYLHPGPFHDVRPDTREVFDPTAFRAFIDGAFDGFLAAGATSVLIDLRDNPGGDNAFSDPMIAWFADRPFRFSNSFTIRVSDAAIAANHRRMESGTGPDSTSARLASLYAAATPGSRVEWPVPWVRPRADRRFDGDVYVLVNRHSYSNAALVAAIVQDFGFGTVLGEETADLVSTYAAVETFRLPASGIEVTFPKARILRPNGDPTARGVVPDHPIAAPFCSDGRDAMLDDAVRKIAADRSRPAAVP